MTVKPARKTTVAAAPTVAPRPETTAEERYLRVQEKAYLKAEADAFRKDAVEYWLAAEAEVVG